MAGRDASTQLGGMLSQIGNTLANRASAGQGLMSPIRNTFRRCSTKRPSVWRPNSRAAGARRVCPRRRRQGLETK